MLWNSLDWIVCAAVLLQSVNRPQAKLAPEHSPKSSEVLSHGVYHNNNNNNAENYDINYEENYDDNYESIIVFDTDESGWGEDGDEAALNDVDRVLRWAPHSRQRLSPVSPRHANQKQTNAIEADADDAADNDDDDDEAVVGLILRQELDGGVAAKIDPDSRATNAQTKTTTTTTTTKPQPKEGSTTGPTNGGNSAGLRAIYNPFGQLVAFFGSDQLHLQDYNFLFNADRHTVFLLHTAVGQARRPGTTSERVLNAVSGSIGAVFGVNAGGGGTRAARVEEVQLYNAASLRQSRYNPFNPTRILVHGWFGGSHANVYSSLVPAYLTLGDGSYNVFTVDWGRGAIADYFTASYRVKPVGRVLARFIDFLHEEAGMRFADLHVVGFSMGAHIAGIAGKHVASGRLPVIYALDPALPFFRYDSVEERVSLTDADYVEVVHTSSGSYGYDRPLGHVDFYVNYGSGQPGCSFFNECSHFRAFQVFAEALLDGGRLRGQGCDAGQWAELVRHRRCRSPTGLNMSLGGDPLDVAALRGRGGVYNVPTNASPPYARSPDPGPGRR